MNRLILMPAALSLLIVAGCSETFPDEEAHLGLEEKIRPYEITLDPPEVAPGETTTATLRYHMPRAAAAAATWRVALDYDAGLYEVDQVERHFVAVADVDPPLVDDAGFVVQTARFTVPDSIFTVTSAIPDELNDDIMVALLDGLPAGLFSDPPRKEEVAAALASLTAEDLAALDPQEAALVHAVADIFACAVRFRVTLDDGMSVDVVRRLTVRHSSRLASPNTNHNNVVPQLTVGEIPRHDFDLGDLDEVIDEVVWHPSDTSDPELWRIEVPLDDGHTYFLRSRATVDRYTSPFDPDRLLEEQLEYRWYYYRLDAPRSGHQFLVSETGEEAEMYELDDDTRIDPPGVGARYRILSVVRDERGEWARYHASPGSSTRVVEIIFTAR
jgi:hypothetical protein